MPLAAQGGWKPAPIIDPIDAGIPTGAPSDSGERTKPVIPGDIPAASDLIR